MLGFFNLLFNRNKLCVVDNEIKEITLNECSDMLDEFHLKGKCSRYGLFWLRDGKHFVAIANESGDMFMEDFSSFRSCLRYLRGNEGWE